MMRHKAKVVVIGRARGGKSYLGNTLMGDMGSDSDDEVNEEFPTSPGDEGFTMDIKSATFFNVTAKKFPGKFDIVYTDTPGFPDTRGVERSLEIYDKIVEFINEEKPTAIIWLLTPTREHHDAALYKTYALLMQEFANKGIYCAILANNNGDYNMKKKQKAEAFKKIGETLLKYGFEKFTHEDPFISVSSKELKKTFLAIVMKGIEMSQNPMHVTALRKFGQLEKNYEAQFDDSTKSEEYVTHLRTLIENRKKDAGWHKQRIKDLNMAITATTAAGGTAGAGFAAFTFGLSAAAAALTVVVSNFSMQLVIKDSEDKREVLLNEIAELTHKMDSYEIEDVMEMHKKGMEELAKIYEAMGDEDKARVLKEKIENF